jgi:simple sugar transport system ATP-binding protein
MAENCFRVVRLLNIVKRFGELVAIHDATLEIRRGEIHALVGENGAGKSTLMNILYGLLQPDSGSVEVNETDVSFGNPEDAIRAGVGMVHQHFKLAPSFTVAENIILGAEPVKSFYRVDRKRAEQETAELSHRFGLDLDPRAIVGSLSVGLRQRVEILKALYRHAQILILDEPTAVLTPQENAGDVRNHASACEERPLDHLHHPQAARSARGIGSHFGDAAGPDRRHDG